MNTKDMVNKFIEYGIPMTKIAEVSQVSLISIKSLRNEIKIRQSTEDKIIKGLKSIALELYTITFSSEKDN